MAGQVCLVTGATSGIGKFVARELACQGAEVILAGRNQQKLDETISWIRSETGHDVFDYLLADFSDLQQVRDLARLFQDRHQKLDVLINNAGSFFNIRRNTPYGVELTFLVNHLAPFLLTNLLLKTLRESEPARIINVSSDAHKYGQINFEDLAFRRGYAGMKAYARSKLANVLFTYELARRLPSGDLTVNALHPGHVATNIWKNDFSIFGPAIKKIMGLFALSPEEGADNTIYLATSPEVGGITGKYFEKRESVSSSPLSYDEGLANKLWEVSENLTALNRQFLAS